MIFEGAWLRYSLCMLGLTREDRIAAGRKKRDELSRAKLSEPAGRKRGFDPVRAVLRAGEGRLPALLPLKYQKMAASPFTFFRGSVGLMAADLARGPNTGLTVQLCGDAHIQNLGSFGTPDGHTVFDINDFDETVPGPWEWDLKRMSVSIILAGEAIGHTREACGSAVETFLRSYCALTEYLAGQPVLAAARYQIHRASSAPAVSGAFRQAERSSHCDLLAKYTKSGADGGMEFRGIDKVLWRLEGREREGVLGTLAVYRKSLAPERMHLFDWFRAVDVAFKVVGTGSVGLRNYVVLMEGNGAGDPLFLQIKQQVASTYAPYLKLPAYRNEGQRVVEGQRRIQPLSDLLLGWTRMGAQHYLVRQLSDHKGGVNLSQLKGAGLRSLAEIAGELLARGHARSGDAAAIHGYIGEPERATKAIGNFAAAYAGVVRGDFEKFQKAIRDGRVKAEK